MLQQQFSSMKRLLSSPELTAIPSKFGKAQLLTTKYNFNKKDVFEAGVCTRQTYLRGLDAVKDG